MDKGFDAPSVLEKMVDIDKEIAVMVAMNEKGQTAIYPPAEMVFDHAIQPAGLPVKPGLY